MTPTRVARAFVRLYPRAWRARYETELLALLDDNGISWLTTFDIARNVAREWGHAAVAAVIAVTESQNRTVLRLRGLMRILFLGALGVLVASVAWRLAFVLDAHGVASPALTAVWVFVLRMTLLARCCLGIGGVTISRPEFWCWIVIDLATAAGDRWMTLGLQHRFQTADSQDWTLFALLTTNPIIFMGSGTEWAHALREHIRRPDVPTKILDI